MRGLRLLALLLVLVLSVGTARAATCPSDPTLCPSAVFNSITRVGNTTGPAASTGDVNIHGLFKIDGLPIPTTFSIASANGFAGSVTSGATPVVTLSVTVSGALKGTAGALGQAAASDLTNGVTGSGLVVLQTTPTITTAVLNGAITGTSMGLTFATPPPLGSTVPNTAAVTTLTASDTVTLSPASHNVTLSPTGTGQVIIAPATAGTLNNMVIGGVTPLAGSFTAISATGQITSTLATGTAPFVVASTTNVANLNASSLSGATFAAPGPIGSGTPSTAAFTTLTASSTVTLSPANTTVTISPTGTGSVTINPATTVTISPTTNLTMTPGGTASLSPTGVLTLKGQTYTAAAAVSLGSASSTVGAGTYYAGHSLIGIQTFCASGCSATGGTYTATAGTNQVIIEVQAAGGGSGGCAITPAGNTCVASSGAGGSYAEGLFTSSFSGITITIGAAGTAGTAGNNPGGTGTTTTAGTLISCPGGTGGAGAATAAGIVAYTAFNFGTAAPAACTQTGGTAIKSIAGGPAGTGWATNTTNGSQFPGTGGSSVLGMAAQAAGGNVATSTGLAGVGYGWGAGGSWQAASQAAATAGLAGGVGRIVIYEFN